MPTISAPCSHTVNNWIIAVFAFNPHSFAQRMHVLSILILIIRYNDIQYSNLKKKRI